MIAVFKWAGRLLLLALSVALVAAGWALWCGQRSAAPVPLAERQLAFERAVGWVKANEATLIADPNSALWWMVQTAAERTGHTYLKELVARAAQAAYGIGPASPWQRVIYPQAPLSDAYLDTNVLEPYQALFIHAVTCRPIIMADGRNSTELLSANTCRPQVPKVFWQDTVCSTHQFMGLQLYRRAACAPQPGMPKVEAELLADIRQQLHWSVPVNDAYIQRVLVMAWFGPADQFEPVWLRRVLDAQQPDGGWMGRWQFPELPLAIQPWPVRQHLARWMPGLINPNVLHTDFHASAQGLLLSALALSAAQTPPDQTLRH